MNAQSAIDIKSAALEDEKVCTNDQTKKVKELDLSPNNVKPIELVPPESPSLGFIS